MPPPPYPGAPSLRAIPNRPQMDRFRAVSRSCSESESDCDDDECEEEEASYGKLLNQLTFLEMERKKEIARPMKKMAKKKVAYKEDRHILKAR